MSLSSEPFGIGFPFASSQIILGIMLGLSKTTFGFGHSLGAQFVIGCYSKRIQSKISKGEKGEKFKRNQAQAFKSPFPMQSHRMYPSPPAMACGNTCKVLSTWGPRSPELLPWSATQAHRARMPGHSSWNSRSPAGKQVFNHKGPCLHKLSRQMVGVV